MHSRPNGFVYVLGISAFALADALKVKSRVFVIVTGIIFVFEHQYLWLYF